jgi:hypothetical protein
MRSAHKILVGNLRGRYHLEDLHVDRILLKWIFKKLDETWTGLIWHKIRTGGGRL